MSGGACLRIGIAAVLATLTVASATAQSSGSFVVICPLDWMVDDAMTVVVERAVRTAQGAEALIFVVDTPGGRVDSAIDISNAILNATCPTIAYIEGMGAISAGALISYSCKQMFMAPGTNIGASAPIIVGLDGSAGETDEKTKSFLRSRYRALGQENGHDPLLGEAMVDQRVELRGYRGPDGNYVFKRTIREDIATAPSASPSPTAPGVPPQSIEDLGRELAERAQQAVREMVRGQPPDLTASEEPAPESPPLADIPPEEMELISPAGELLTLTTDEALRYGLIEAKVESLEELLALKGLENARQVWITPNWSERLFSWLTSPMISGLLLMIGLAALYLEIRTPGFGAAGMVGIICLAIFLGSYLIIGIANWMDVMLVLIGIALLLIEVFVLPGFGFVGVIGGVCMILGIYLSLTRVPIPQYSWDFDRLGDAGQTVATAAGLFLLFCVVTWKIFPKTPVYRQLVLSHAQQAEAGYAVQTEDDARHIVGLRGVAETMLRPSGRARIEGRLFDVVTHGEYIDAGRPVQIIEVEGNQTIVKEIKEDRS